ARAVRAAGARARIRGLAAPRRVRAAGRRAAERRPVGREPPAPQPRDRVDRAPGRAAPGRADCGARPGAAPTAVGPGRRASPRGWLGLLRDAEPRGAAPPRRPRRPPRRREAQLPGLRARGPRLRRIALLLGKDLRVLARSPLLLGVLVTYPLVVAVLVGLVAGYANT